MQIPDLLKSWVESAAGRAEVTREIHRLYDDLQAEIDLRRPLCVISGRCCRFDVFGHRLYVTTAELATFIADRSNEPPLPDNPGGCVFQHNKMCQVHAIRPMGCRIFFCDATATEWQESLYSRFHQRLKSLHESLNVPYAYVEWRDACRAVGLAAVGPALNET